MPSRLIVAVLIGFILLPAIPVATALPAKAAAACAAWKAEMEEDEGGPVLTASVCAKGASPAPALMLQCFTNALFRYDPGPSSGPDADPGTSLHLTFATETGSLEQQLDFQEMDATFAAELSPAAPLLALLRSGSTVTVTDGSGRLPTKTFTLAGSSAAIGKVLGKCGAEAPGGD